MTAARLLRTAVFTGLALLALHLWRAPARDVGGALRLPDADAIKLTEALLSPRPPARIIWSGETPPNAGALWMLSPGPALPPLTLPVGRERALEARPPRQPVAGRGAALTVDLRGAPDDRVQVRWGDALGLADSLSIQLDQSGRSTVGLRVLPARPGWQTWRVAVAADSVEVGAWVSPTRPLRVLALAGAPDWESRFALRALEEAGAQVEARFDLGRVALGGQSVLDLTATDVVLLFGPAGLGGGASERLRAFVAGGGGVLIAAANGEGLRPVSGPVGALLRGWAMADSVLVGPALPTGGSPVWSLPAELTRLPAAPSRAATVALAGPTRGVVAARDSQGRPLALLAALGRGRAAFLGLPESWRWRMEAGQTEAHRAWWMDWATWAAGGLREPIQAAPIRPRIAVGAVAEVQLLALDSLASLPTEVQVLRPDGVLQSVPIAEGMRAKGAGAYDGGLGTARFLADLPGAYRVTWPGGETGISAEIAPPEPNRADRSLVALASGRPAQPGVPVPADGSSRAQAEPWTPDGAPLIPRFAGVLLLALLGSEWTLRRRGGGP